MSDFMRFLSWDLGCLGTARDEKATSHDRTWLRGGLGAHQALRYGLTAFDATREEGRNDGQR